MGLFRGISLSADSDDGRCPSTPQAAGASLDPALFSTGEFVTSSPFAPAKLFFILSFIKKLPHLFRYGSLLLFGSFGARMIIRRFIVISFI
jgi:hypothetical protein